MKLVNSVLIVVLAVLLAGCGKPTASETTGPGAATLKPSAPRDAEMEAAALRARETFPRFADHWKTSGPAKHTMVKVFIPDANRPADGEVMWVSPTSLESSPMRGTLANEPDWLKTVKRGDGVSFTTNDVFDWIYIESNRAVGAYTIQVQRKRMSEAERKTHDAGYPFAF